MNPKEVQESQKASSSSSISKNNFIKDIDALYKTQIKQISTESKERMQSPNTEEKVDLIQSPRIKKSRNPIGGGNQQFHINSLPQNEKKGLLGSGIIEQEKVRASTFLQGQSTVTIERLRKENEVKELKLRQLANKCENLIEKLKNHLPPQQFEIQLESLKEFSDRKMQRLQNLFKIKNEQIFFKIKLQIIGLLQEFQVSKEQITGINEVTTQSALFSFMVRKLKIKLKDFRSKEQESNYELQKDKIMNQKNEERIHYLVETNELLKLSQTKLKNKIDDLRSQLNDFLQKIKAKEMEIEEKDNQIFRLKKHNEELQVVNQKLIHQQKNTVSEKNDEKRIYEAKQKEMKGLLSSYYVERKKLQNQLQEKDGYIQELLIKQKYLQQENERVNREFIRWKERYEWLEKEKENRQKQFEDQKSQLINDFETYKNENNQGVYLNCKSQTDEALRKIEEYQQAYQKILLQLDQERKISIMKEEEAQRNLEEVEKEWFEKIKRIQKMKEEEILQITTDHDNRQNQIKEDFKRRQELIEEEMNAKMKAMIAENIRDMTEKLIQIEEENQDLNKQIDELTRVIEVKDSLINAITASQSQQQQQQ